MSRSAQSSIATIDQFIQQVGAQTKQAADPKSEPGSIGGETQHPVKNVDDRLQEPVEGERFKENTKDVNADQGAPSVQKAPEAKAASIFDVAARHARPTQKQADGALMTPGSAADDHLQMGTNVQPTGEDPKNETSSAKGGKDDKKQGNRGGTTHPASTENDSLDGHKYAVDVNMSLEKLASVTKEIGEILCAQIGQFSKQAQEQSAPAAKQAVQQPVSDAALQHMAGWELAGLVTGQFDKQAADTLVQQYMYDIVKAADARADLFIDYMQARDAELQQQTQKRAEGGLPPDAMPPDASGGEAGGADAMMAALGGGADAGGGAPPGGEAPPGGDAGADPEVLQLAQILAQMGVTPEELEAALAQESGAGGGPPPGAGGPPPGGGMAPPGGGMAPPPGGGMEAQASDKLAAAKAYITEVVQRSRARKAS